MTTATWDQLAALADDEHRASLAWWELVAERRDCRTCRFVLSHGPSRGRCLAAMMAGVHAAAGSTGPAYLWEYRGLDEARTRMLDGDLDGGWPEGPMPALPPMRLTHASSHATTCGCDEWAEPRR